MGKIENKTTNDNHNQITSLTQVKCFLLDMDGTIHISGTAIDGAVDAIERMRQSARVLFVTNNTSIGRIDYVQKLAKMGIVACEDDIYTASNATTDYLFAIGQTKKIFLLGTKKLYDEFIKVGIEVVRENPSLVVIGFDTDLTYENLSLACKFIREGVPFIATHPDINCPVKDGYIPDVGSFLALIKSSTNKEPKAICGKPFTPIGDGIKLRTGVEPHLTAMVGDRLATDMVFAKNNNYVSVLTLTGEATQDDLKQSGMTVDFCIDTIANWDQY